MIRERWERVKQHVKDHKVAYSIGITAIVTAGITCVIMRESHAGLIDRTQRELQDHRVHGFSHSFFF